MNIEVIIHYHYPFIFLLVAVPKTAFTITSMTNVRFPTNSTSISISPGSMILKLVFVKPMVATDSVIVIIMVKQLR